MCLVPRTAQGFTTSMYPNTLLPSIRTSQSSSSSCSSSMKLYASDPSSLEQMTFISDISSKAIIVLTAGILGIASQSFINSMLKGDQGLSAFLSDGKDFQGSNFKPNNSKDKKEDPLPWLKLPTLDFVEVTGQSVDEAEISRELEMLKERGRLELEEGDTEKAQLTRDEMNAMMEKYGFEFKEES